MSNAFSLIAAEEGGGGGGVSTYKKLYGGSGTVGKVVQMLDDGSIADMPLRGWDCTDQALVTLTNNNYVSIGKYSQILPTSDPTVFVSFFQSGSSPYYIYTRIFRINADNSITFGSTSYLGQSGSVTYSGGCVRLGTSNTYLIMQNTTNQYPTLTAFAVDPSSLTATVGSIVTLQSSSAYGSSLVAMDNDSAVAVFADYVTGAVKVTNVTVSGTTVSVGSPTTVLSYGANVYGYDLGAQLVSGQQILIRAAAKVLGVTRSGNNFSVGFPVALTNASASDALNYTRFTNRQGDYYEVLNANQVLHVWISGGSYWSVIINITYNTVSMGAVTFLAPNAGMVTNYSYLSNVFNMGGSRRTLYGYAWGHNGGTPYTYRVFMASFVISGSSIIADNNLTYLTDTSNGTSISELGELLPDGSMLVRLNLPSGVSSNVGTYTQLMRVKLLPDLSFVIQSNSAVQFSATGGSIAMYAPGTQTTVPIIGPSGYRFVFGAASSGSSSVTVLSVQRLGSWSKGRPWGILQASGEVLFVGVSTAHSNLVVGQKYFYDPWTDRSFKGRIIRTPTVASTPAELSLQPIYGWTGQSSLIQPNN
ncbi:hypothetical protein [Paenibacillus hexagrammi]|uniref:Uncharacterized protein n=1 Tax=Paenibacillus hexagrammi TaxID=2908839 RepID=A0ABY3SRD7_9BACL|nr:hypothetical protein [Paenibacillus sp. YPD9-1]UJF36622.1 hypothetical protein L0M14_30500 [Paenibacillus sp. YPD9-1]